MIFGRAALRIAALEDAQGDEARREPFVSGCTRCISNARRSCRVVKLAGGEGASDFFQARHLIDSQPALPSCRSTRGPRRRNHPPPSKWPATPGPGASHMSITRYFAAGPDPLAATVCRASKLQVCEYPIETSELAQAINQRTSWSGTRTGRSTCPRRAWASSPIFTVERYVVDVKDPVAGPDTLRNAADLRNSNRYFAPACFKRCVDRQTGSAAL